MAVGAEQDISTRAAGPGSLHASSRHQQRAYYDALADAQLRASWGPWMRLFCQSVVEASDGAIAIDKDLNAIRANWHSQLADLRSDATALQLPAFLLGHPVVSVKQVEAAFEVSFVAANRAIEQLVERGILNEPRRRRNRAFHATEILSRLEQE